MAMLRNLLRNLLLGTKHGSGMCQEQGIWSSVIVAVVAGNLQVYNDCSGRLRACTGICCHVYSDHQNYTRNLTFDL